MVALSTNADFNLAKKAAFPMENLLPAEEHV
jgi:hypothetical protein